MTQDEIIEMAKESGLIVNSPHLMPHDHVLRGIKAFAKLVSAKERERIANMVDGLSDGEPVYLWWVAEQIRARGEA